ncbi:hypothetical protein [Streptomyces exfoliatus]|uniref:hypothetical protein n=1 Tax=Streptomyces exfoliatus TaxID=1905 RepID=UPI003C2D4F05
MPRVGVPLGKTSIAQPPPMIHSVNVRLFARRRVQPLSCAAFSFASALFGLLVANAIFLTVPAEEFGFGSV